MFEYCRPAWAVEMCNIHQFMELSREVKYIFTGKRMKKRKRLIQALAENYRDGEAPPCAHFGECGGCLFQDISYKNQLALKEEYLRTELGDVCDVGPVRPSMPYGYRGRMDMVTAFGKVGLRKRGSYRRVVDIESCAIMQEKSNTMFREIRPLVSSVEDYDYLRHEGYLRYVVLRQGMYTGELMVNFVVAMPEDRLGGVIEALPDGVDSVSILVTGGRADVSFGEVWKTVQGGTIGERLGDFRFSIAPNSFFQSNSSIALLMYERIRSMVKGRTLDLYSGVGSISLFVAGAADSVTGVEMNPEGVAMAEHNRELNGIENARFVHGDVLGYLRECVDRYDTVVLDPPRAGMHPAAAALLSRLAPERIVYMSCNPASFREDLSALADYRVESFEAFDMFPQTPHIETLALLIRR